MAPNGVLAVLLTLGTTGFASATLIEIETLQYTGIDNSWYDGDVAEVKVIFLIIWR